MTTNWKTIKSGTLTAQAKVFDTATVPHLTTGSGKVVTKLYVEHNGKFLYQYDRGDEAGTLVREVADLLKDI